MMKYISHIFAVLFAVCTFCACEEKSEVNTEFDNWGERNEAFMKDTLAYAVRQVAAAQQQWKDAWEDHCDWRVYPSYLVTEGGKTTWKDSIAVHIIERGEGSGCPMYTDSVRVTYAGRMMPTKSYMSTNPDDYYYHFPGYVFDKTGLSNKVCDALDKRFERPTIFKVSGVVEGFTTALLHMHIDDYWRVFIPSNMAYGESGSKSIPGESTLVFDMRLKAYYRVGSTPGPWKAPQQ